MSTQRAGRCEYRVSTQSVCRCEYRVSTQSVCRCEYRCGCRVSVPGVPRECRVGAAWAQVDKMFSEMDLNRDKRISLYEFKTAG